MKSKNSKTSSNSTVTIIITTTSTLLPLLLLILLLLTCSLQFVATGELLPLSSSDDNGDPLQCATFSDCFNCLTIGGIGAEVNGSRCSWCSHTMTCIPQEMECGNSTIHAVGKMGIRKDSNTKSTFYNTIVVSSKSDIVQQESILNNCSSRIDSLAQCVLGSQYAKIYLPVSTSTRNLQPGGLPAQPILPITKEFLEAYVVSDIDLVSKNITPRLVTQYMHELAYNNKNTVLVGAYMIGAPKKGQKATPFTMFSSVGYKGFKANYTIDPKTKKLTVRKGKSQDSVILHLLPTNIGLHASKGKYRMGVVVALMNEKTTDQPKCLFYPIPDPISVKPVYQDVVIGIYLYVGIPLFFVGIILVIIYSKFCPFADSKKLSQATYEEKEKRELEDLKRTDNTIGEIETIDATVNQKRHHFSLRWFWKVTSDQVIAQSGLRGYYYWKFYRRLVLIVFLYGFLAMTILLPINIVNNKRLHGVVDFAVTTFGSIARNGSTSIAHYVIGIVFFLITVVMYAFSIRLGFYKRRYEASIFTARLRHLPDLHIKVGSDSNGRVYVTNPEDIAMRETLLTQHFNDVLKKVLIADANNSIQSPTATSDTTSPSNTSLTVNEATNMPDPVLSVNVIADMSHILSDVDTQYQLEQTIDESNGKKSILGRAKKRRLKSSRKSMLEKIEKKPIVSTQAFITFRSALALRRCKMIYKSSKKKSRTTTIYSDEISCGVDSWKMRQVTWEPEDVEWDHIYDSTRRNVYGTSFVYFIYFIAYLMLIAALLIYFFRYGVYGLHSSLHYKQAFYIMDSAAFLKGLIPVVLGFASSVFSVFLTIAGEIANVIMRIVTGHERMKSKSKTSASYLLKSVFIIIPFYLTIPFLGDYQVEQMHPESFYNNVGLALMQFVLSYLFFYKGLELLICVAKITISYIQTGGEPERIPFDFNVAYTSALTNFFIIAVTGIRIPLLYIPGVAFFVMSYLVDTFLLLFFYERAVGTGRIEFSLVTALLLVFGAAAMLAHPSMSLLLAFGSLVFVAVSLSIICVIVYIYNRRGTRRSTQVQVHDEGAYANKYFQPHLKILLRKLSEEEIEMPDVQLGGDSADVRQGEAEISTTEKDIEEMQAETIATAPTTTTNIITTMEHEVV